LTYTAKAVPLDEKAYQILGVLMEGEELIPRSEVSYGATPPKNAFSVH
jgi:hypothetical protein